jgi:hypothetical protein
VIVAIRKDKGMTITKVRILVASGMHREYTTRHYIAPAMLG